MDAESQILLQHSLPSGYLRSDSPFSAAAEVRSAKQNRMKVLIESNELSVWELFWQKLVWMIKSQTQTANPDVTCRPFKTYIVLDYLYPHIYNFFL